LAVSNHAAVQRLSRLLLDWGHDNKAVLHILVAVAVGFAIGRKRANRAGRASDYENRLGFATGRFRRERTYRDYEYQNPSEALISRVVQTNFGPPGYHLMNHVTLQMEDGTTQVDHILVSRFGVFIIETKDYNGWIFANAKQANWTQVLFNRRFKFQNPIFQNARHVRAVQDLLDFLPAGVIKSVVVFTGKAEFKTEVPQGVFCTSELVDYLREHTVEVMSLNRLHFCVGRLETARLAISGETDIEHAQSLERRHAGRLNPSSLRGTKRGGRSDAAGWLDSM